MRGLRPLILALTVLSSAIVGTSLPQWKPSSFEDDVTPIEYGRSGVKLENRASATSTPSPHFPWNGTPSFNSSIRPLVMWHGMGDSAYSAAMIEFAELVRAVHPGMFVHLIYIEDTLEKDQRAGFFGNVWEQLERVHEQLSNITELKYGFDALGFSQGGQFLRAYVEKYNDPPVNNLITFGSQHMGVSDLPVCRPGDVFCQLMRIAARRGVYSAYAQHNLVQAQYFRDPNRLEAYYERNEFLALVNGEVEDTRDKDFKKNLLDLNELVLVMFSRDTTVVPKESSWFGSLAPPEDGEQEKWGEAGELLPMRMQPLYQEDWIGLRKLDEDGRVALLSCDGEHMQLPRDCWEPIVGKYTGGLVQDAKTPSKGISASPDSPPMLRIQS